MITYEDYIQYLKDNDFLVCNETFSHAEKKERRRRRCFKRAEQLKNHDLSKYKNKEEAEIALREEGEKMVVGCGGIVYVLLSSIISWMIEKLLKAHFG